jgi:hypothetical protein
VFQLLVDSTLQKVEKCNQMRSRNIKVKWNYQTVEKVAVCRLENMPLHKNE